MTAHLFCIAQFPDEHRPHVIDPLAAAEAREAAPLWAEVLAFSRAHAMRLWREGVESVRDCEGRLATCGIVVEHNEGRY